MQSAEFFSYLQSHGISCFSGVPDSLLKDFCAYVTDHVTPELHTITANEGNAIALAAGHFLASGSPACVYMQNSGLGNCVNPLLSLMDGEVYGIPVLMLIGWRGEPGRPDEPQHAKQGKVSDALLDAMGIAHFLLPEHFEEARPVLDKAFALLQQDQPVALIVRKGLFAKYALQQKPTNLSSLPREQAIDAIAQLIRPLDLIVSTTGQISRELYELRNAHQSGHQRDFLTVGSMGHASSIALGIALQKPERNVFCLDGDGAFLMHMGCAVVNASKRLPNFRHIVLNNGVHDSVGAQPTAIGSANVRQLALAAGYASAFSAETADGIRTIWPAFMSAPGPALLEIRVRQGARPDLGRPKESPQQNKALFMQHTRHAHAVYPGAVGELSHILQSEHAHDVLLFTGKASWKTLQSRFANAFNDVHVTQYNDFTPNPHEEDVLRAIQALQGKQFDIIVAIGGGSVLDFAKAFRKLGSHKFKLVAIPTTFGTGAETTRFAVLYVNGEKTSLDAADIQPDYALVDADLATGQPQYLKACTVMDAFCQAIESFWAVGSTEESRLFARDAIVHLRDAIVPYVTTDATDAAERVAKGAYLAGRAINISRTTAAHALSYALTTRFGLPHGHAVALTLPTLWQYNAVATPGQIVEPRGAKYVATVMNELGALVDDNPISYFQSLYDRIGLEYRFDRLGIARLEFLAEAVNAERLGNNPVRVDVHKFLQSCLTGIPRMLGRLENCSSV